MLSQCVLLMVLIAFSKPLHANLADEEKKYYLNEGTIYTPNNILIPIIALNANATFNKANQPLVVDITNRKTNITIINNTTSIQYFCTSTTMASNQIAPKGSFIIEFDHHLLPLSYYYIIALNKKDTVAGGLILNEPKYNPNAKNYFWNFFNFDSVKPGNAQFQFHTVNNQFYPEILTDISARINLSLGDTAIIYAINTGKTTQVIHLHGFHLYIAYNSASNIINHIYKDTFVLSPSQILKLRLVADKRGIFSVNRVNYVPSYSSNYLPNGMFMTFKINE